MHVTNDLPPGCSLPSPVGTVNCTHTLKAALGAKLEHKNIGSVNAATVGDRGFAMDSFANVL
jgi:hypothetical protein